VGLRLFAGLKAAESNIDSALQLAVLRRSGAISLEAVHAAGLAQQADGKSFAFVFFDRQSGFSHDKK
jgi:hypothetical protein